MRAESRGEEKGKRSVPKKTSPGKNPIDKHRPYDRRLSKDGVWRRKLTPFDLVRILRIGEPGKGSFKGEMVVRLKPVDGGQTVNYLEDDFLLLFEPIISAVRED